MPGAVFKDEVPAASDLCHVVERNYHFPPAFVDRRHSRTNHTHTVCHWKVVAGYFHIDAGGETIVDGA